MQDLAERIGLEHVERRLKIEVEHEAQLFGQGLILFNLENWYSAPWTIRTALKLAGLYGRARRNADHVVVKKHSVAFANLPPAFDNFTILHISDLHADKSVGAMRHLVSVVGGLQYDICVLRLSRQDIWSIRKEFRNRRRTASQIEGASLWGAW